MPLEKEHQSEAYRTLNQLGWSHKLVQDTVVCTNCHRPIHPIHKGWPDYTAELRAIPYDIPIKVECKGNTDRFKFRQLSREQRTWWVNYHGVGYMWLQLGDGPVNSTKSNHRQVWMIPYKRFIYICSIMLRKTGYLYLPLNPTARITSEFLTVPKLFMQYNMEWMPNGKCWRPNKLHPIWDLEGLQTTYAKFNPEN